MGAQRTFFWEKLPKADLWYLVGLIASDGCLSPDGRHIDITSQDKDYLESIRHQFELSVAVSQKLSGYTNRFGYRIQFSSKSFYNFLSQIGLTPKKSKTIGALNIPKTHFCHFLRGVIDGDGCIRNWIHPQNGIEQWIVKISSGSENFLKWLAQTIADLYQIYGALHPKYTGATFELKYGKLAAQELLKICYSGDVFALPRKKEKANQCIQTKRGWQKSKTIDKESKVFARVAELVDAQDSFGSPSQ